jgi:uncharacterized membrane protein
MATVAYDSGPARPRSPLAPNLFERLIAAGSIVLLAALLFAAARGLATAGRVPPPLVSLHLLTLTVALALTPILLLRRRGDRWHRLMGWAWCVAMFSTAVITLFIRHVSKGSLGGLHIFSFITIVSVPLLVVAARSHKVGAHRRTVSFLILGALLIAGVFTFIPPRILGSWMFT